MASPRKLQLGPSSVRVAHGDGELELWVGDDHHVFALDRGFLTLDGRVMPYFVHRQGARVQVWMAGRMWHLESLAEEGSGGTRADVAGDVLAPMPGTVLKVLVQAGDEVQARQTLVVMESMKMELSVAAGADGRVAAVQCQPGDLVEASTVLIKLEASMQLPDRVHIVEVGPRDGLQNEPERLSVEQKRRFIEALAATGLRDLEVGAFVHPKWVPQMANSDEVMRSLPAVPGVRYSALVPNLKGLERALETGLRRIAVFTAASESFTHKNINTSIQGSLDMFRPVVQQAQAAGVTVRGYVSTAFVCPYEGNVTPEAVWRVTDALLLMGVDEVSLGDTIGAAAPTDVETTLGYLLRSVPAERLALHFHDTYGTAVANVVAAMALGIRTFDASAGGLGGCPYAPGASGNLATEDLVYLLHRMGISTGVDLERLADASLLMEEALGRALPSKQLQRIKASRLQGPGVGGQGSGVEAEGFKTHSRKTSCAAAVPSPTPDP